MGLLLHTGYAGGSELWVVQYTIGNDNDKATAAHVLVVLLGYVSNCMVWMSCNDGQCALRGVFCLWLSCCCDRCATSLSQSLAVHQ